MDSTDRIEEIKQVVKDSKLALAAGLEVDKIDLYSLEEVQTFLKQLPSTKYQAGRRVVSALVTFKDKKRALNKVKAQMMMRANSLKGELTNAQDRKAWADERPEVEAAEVDLIDAEAQLRINEMQYEAFDDAFDAVRKIATIQVEQERDKNRIEHGGSV